ncbi:pilus assembly protein [Micrococcus porci]|uniref:TadE/TadG family type IV pilus assembly protein n=1 Tax=Micrococcus TaxID=1269 RepID=UPI001CCBAE81|nr:MULTISPECIES: TadE/TadG family type IV pilus assembly protein [Micrococcus]MCG7421767.1 pilus assembly protein [Micrococcus sp. ACRRV]UBH24288.1 pilus assembly protein [Micrococcus porci]
MEPAARPAVQGRPGPDRRAGDRGSVVAENAMVTALLVLLFAAVLQVGIIVHVRNVMIDAASAGARYGALADRDPAEGAARARDVLSASVPGQSGAQVRSEPTTVGGVPVVRVTITSSLPGLGFLPGPVPIEVHGHAFRY